MSAKFYAETVPYKKILSNPVKKWGFLPEKESEIFVSDIPKYASIHDLSNFFEQVGEIFQVKLMVRRNENVNRGFGFVTYMSKELARKAINELQHTKFMNGYLQLQISVDNCRIFVGGIPVNKTKDEIWQELKSCYGLHNIVDVITYRSYSNPLHNRGFVFLEFRTHEEASYFRAKFHNKLFLFGLSMLVDWSVPIIEVDASALAEVFTDEVKILFLRNLDVALHSDVFANQIHQLVENRACVDKIYKFKDYAYIHLNTRVQAEVLLKKLQKVYANTLVEVQFAKPPNKFTDKSFRDKTLAYRRAASIPKSQVVTRHWTPVSNASPYSFHSESRSSSDSTMNSDLNSASPMTLSPLTPLTSPRSHYNFSQTKQQVTKNQLEYLTAQNLILRQQLQLEATERAILNSRRNVSPMFNMNTMCDMITSNSGPGGYLLSPGSFTTAPGTFTTTPGAFSSSRQTYYEGAYASSAPSNELKHDVESMVTRMVNRLLDE
ncbi:APOBEC1 complementation factor-like isoform X1 [Euwallacea fornicatus]|uniref:APOBEC1 complementation factor-like isoform X1 n=1 Tax=Euwallacea fornicatus TaxID=995702 RepID=UPI00338DDEF5